MQTLVIILTLTSVITTLLPYIRSEHWWIRIFDYPKLLIFSIAFSLLILSLLLSWDFVNLRLPVLLSLSSVLIIQGAHIAPFAPFSLQEVPAAVPSENGQPTISMMLANVFMYNTNSQGMLDLVRKYNPDVLLAMEINQWWAGHLDDMTIKYPYHVKQPLENTYGISLYSRYELQDAKVKYLVDEDIPSIHGKLNLPGGAVIRFHALHPKPPLPEESMDTTQRDAELLLLARSLKETNKPVIVMGDLNDVSWSRVTRLFLKISGLLDPRKGRGMYNSYNARIPLLRWQLDHLFHSEHFEVAAIERLPACGSDHFPMLYTLKLKTGIDGMKAAHDLSAQELEYAEHKIRRGSPLETRPFSHVYPQNLSDKQPDSE